MALTIFWAIFLAVCSSAVAKLLDRYIVKSTSPYAYSLLTQLFSAALLLPLAITNITFPTASSAWLAFSIAIFIWATLSVCSYTSTKRAGVSIREPLNQSKIIWVLLFGIIFLGESVTFADVIGTIIMFLGLTTLIFHPERKWGRLTDPGVKLALMTAFLGATVSIIDKYALRYFIPEVYGFLVYLFPGLILLTFLPKRKHEVAQLLKTRGIYAFFAIVFSTGAYFFTLKAYKLADITVIYPFLQSGVILTCLISIFFMGEHEHKWQKIIATAIVVTGAIIMKIG